MTRRSQFAPGMAAQIVDRIDAGRISVRGRQENLNTPRAAIRPGIGFLTEDRKRQGPKEQLNAAIQCHPRRSEAKQGHDPKHHPWVNYMFKVL